MTSPLILYGGTFNPIHRGHIGVCREVHKRFPDAEILLMPTAIPPHKENREVIDGLHRLRMCKIACQDFSYVKVDDYELACGGKSYTIDTLHYLKHQFPDRPLYLLIGTDMFLTFRQWRRWKEIGTLAVLLVASRLADDHKELEDARDSLNHDKIKAILLENTADVVSSTEVREELRAKGMSEALSQKVQDYILFNNLYGSKWNERCLEKLRDTVKSKTCTERYVHTLAVEQEAVKLARRYGADVQKAAVCGILHDICKNMSTERMLQLVTDSGIITDIPFEHQPQLLHGYAGAEYIRSNLGVEDEEIIAAVRYHTTGRCGMSLLEEVIYLADLTSSDRHYPDVDKLRELTSQSVKAGMRYSLSYIIGRLARDGNYICQDTVAAYNFYFGYAKAATKNREETE